MRRYSKSVRRLMIALRGVSAGRDGRRAGRGEVGTQCWRSRGGAAYEQGKARGRGLSWVKSRAGSERGKRDRCALELRLGEDPAALKVLEVWDLFLEEVRDRVRHRAESGAAGGGPPRRGRERRARGRGRAGRARGTCGGRHGQCEARRMRERRSCACAGTIEQRRARAYHFRPQGARVLTPLLTAHLESVRESTKHSRGRRLGLSEASGVTGFLQLACGATLAAFQVPAASRRVRQVHETARCAFSCARLDAGRISRRAVRQ